MNPDVQKRASGTTPAADKVIKRESAAAQSPPEHSEDGSATNEVLDAARLYSCQLGWPVFPVHSARDGVCSCGDAECRSPAKHPLTEHGLNDASTDAATVQSWWSRFPDANVGVRTGSVSGMVVIDVDPRHGGTESLAALTEERGELPPTVEAVTGGGGRHFIFAHPGINIRNRTNIRPGIDVRGDGGYIVAPPSMHVSGTRYRWREGCSPLDLPPAPLPAWLLNVVTAEPATNVCLRIVRADGDLGLLLQAATRYVQGCAPAAEGSRNDAAFALAGHLFAFRTDPGGAGLSEPQILDLVRIWNHQNMPPLPEAELAEVVSSACRNGTPREPHLVCAGHDHEPAEADAAKERGCGAQCETQAATLVQLADEAELFHYNEESYASFSVCGHRETHALCSRTFKTWLMRRFYDETGRVPGAQPLNDALGLLRGRALFDGPALPVAVRMAEYEGAYWIDLADSDWRAVRIDASGWRVMDSEAVPIRFVRRRAMRALPVPIAGGSIDELRPFVNLRNEADWALLAAWLVAALRPAGPYPVLLISGEQGSAKSTLCRLLRALVDPNAAPLRSEPRDVRDLMISASGSWLVVLDNLSRLSPSLSDALCRLSTGGGFATRELYADAEEIIFDATRPVILNGIEAVATRPDLLDRCITLTLQPITEDQRRTEAELWADFERVQPRILGALLTAMSAAMGRVSNVRLASVPRMADFAVWATAAEPGLGLPEGAFLRAYSGDRAAAHETVIENSLVGRAIVAFVSDAGSWRGTPAELLAELNGHADEQMRKNPEWPRGPRKLSGELRQLAPSLRATGISVDIPSRRTGRQKRLEIHLDNSAARHSAPSAHPANPPLGPSMGDEERSVADCPRSGMRRERSAGSADPEAQRPVADCAVCAECCPPGLSERGCSAVTKDSPEMAGANCAQGEALHPEVFEL